MNSEVARLKENEAALRARRGACRLAESGGGGAAMA
jgi:hypothetical protein